MGIACLHTDEPGIRGTRGLLESLHTGPVQPCYAIATYFSAILIMPVNGCRPKVGRERYIAGLHNFISVEMIARKTLKIIRMNEQIKSKKQSNSSTDKVRLMYHMYQLVKIV